MEPPSSQNSGEPSMMMADDGFQSVSIRKNKNASKPKRLYVGNLPIRRRSNTKKNDEGDDEDHLLCEKLVDLLKTQGHYEIESRNQITLYRGSKKCVSFALISLSPSSRIEDLVQKLNRHTFEGKKLVARCEHAKDVMSPEQHSSSFRAPTPSGGFGNSWARPAQEATVEEIGEIVSDAMEYASDPATSAIVSTAALTLVMEAATSSAGEEEANPDYEEVEEGRKGTTNESFNKRQQRLEALLADYGEQDTSWREFQPTTTNRDVLHNTPEGDTLETPVVTAASEFSPLNRLGLYGKAPLHVEMTSFGYHHGAPSGTSGGGWSHSQPLSPFDLRGALPPVPHYLAWQHGMSGPVKREYLNATGEVTAHKLSVQIANQVLEALVAAIDDGYDYSLPLSMSIYVGSELGRHRSVVVVERAATQLRKLLRSNINGTVKAPCSVRTRHRDLERNSNNNTNTKISTPGQNDDW